MAYTALYRKWRPKTFDEVREICGFPIDHAFLNCKKELEAYGYQVGKITMKDRTIQFHPWKQG